MFLRSHAKNLKGKIYLPGSGMWFPLPKRVNDQIVAWHAEAKSKAEMGKPDFYKYDYPATEMNGERIVYHTITRGDGSFELERIIGVDTKVFYDVNWGPVVDGMAGSSGYFPPDYSV